MVERSFLPGQRLSPAGPEVHRGPSRFLRVTSGRSRGRAPSTWTYSNHAAPQATSAVISPLLAPALPDPPLSHYPAQYPRPTSSGDSTAPEVPVGCGQGSGRWRRRPCPWTAVQGLARDLPETALHATSRRPTTQPSAAPFTCAVAWVGEAAHGDVN